MIELKFKNQILKINPLGGGIAQYYILENGERRDIIYGYGNEENKAGSMGDILFPFPGRVKDSIYEFDGKKYLLSGTKIKDGHAKDGFAKINPWKIPPQKENEAKLLFEMTEEEYEPKGFPFSLQLTLHYSLSKDGFTCRAEVLNFGSKPAPFGLGFHPYFSLGANSVNDLEIKIPAKKLVEFDNNLFPTGKTIDLEYSSLNFGNSKKIKENIIDNCFCGLDTENGIAKTCLTFQDYKVKIWQDRNFPYLQIYSGDTIPEQYRRHGLAVEPQTCTGFALNKPEMGLIILSPDEKFIGSWGVEIKRNNI